MSDPTELALAHFQAVLNDKDATASAKASAANGLAQIGKQQGASRQGRVHTMSRAELTAEIDRVRSMLGH